MAYILCIETATTVCSVALFQDLHLVAFQEYHLEKSHATLLPAIIDTSLSNAGIMKQQLHAIAVSEGPGSYTGLRIGASVAKGLCFALDVPLIAINTLSSMAAGVGYFNQNKALLCPMIDARRMEVYTAVYDWENNLIEEVTPKIIDGTSFSEFLGNGEVWFFGDGAMKCRELLGHHPNARFIEGIYPSAKPMGVEALKRFNSGVFEDIAYFEPRYLKEFRITKPKTSN